MGILAIAGIAKAVPLVAHPIGCMGGQHNPASDEAAIPDANGKVSIVVDESGFRPSSVQMKKGQKVTLEFRRTTDRTCATSVAFPDLELEKPLPLNQTVVVELPASLSSTLTFQCGMGMYHGKVVVH